MLLGANSASGQKYSRRDLQKDSCKAGGVSFVCPEGFQALPVEEGQQNIALFFQRKYNLGLFVIGPEAGYDEQKLLSDATNTSLAKFFPKESSSYDWKPMDYSDSVSKFEIGGGMTKGFNGKLVVIVKYRHIKVDHKELFVGDIAQFFEGSEAKDFFQQDKYGDSIVGCDSAVEVIYSVTGEKLDEENRPCAVVTRIPAG